MEGLAQPFETQALSLSGTLAILKSASRLRPKPKRCGATRPRATKPRALTYTPKAELHGTQYDLAQDKALATLPLIERFP